MGHSIKKIFSSMWKSWFFSLLISIIVATSFKSAIADWYVIPTGSMKPTIVEGDRIFVNKLAYDLKIPYTTYHMAEWNVPKRGEIVVFYSPDDSTRLIKRVIGLPGDILAMRNNQLILNGQPLHYMVDQGSEKHSSENGPHHYSFIENIEGIKHSIRIVPGNGSLRSFGPVRIPEGEYFMLGDNRDNSADSRYFGTVKRDLIIGRANAIVASFDIQDKYQPRWNRFFSELL